MPQIFGDAQRDRIEHGAQPAAELGVAREEHPLAGGERNRRKSLEEGGCRAT